MNPALPKPIPCTQGRGKDKDWHYVYLLASKRTSWIYIGCTNNLIKRLQKHNDGKVFSTKKMLPIEIIYYEAYKSKDCAYKREKNLKAYGSGLAKLKSRLAIDKKGRAG